MHTIADENEIRVRRCDVSHLGMRLPVPAAQLKSW